MSLKPPIIGPAPLCPHCGSHLSAVTWTCVLGEFCPGQQARPADTWQHAADVSQQLVADIANKANDKADTELDSMRVHDGMTLDEFLAGK